MLPTGRCMRPRVEGRVRVFKMKRETNVAPRPQTRPLFNFILERLVKDQGGRSIAVGDHVTVLYGKHDGETGTVTVLNDKRWATVNLDAGPRPGALTCTVRVQPEALANANIDPWLHAARCIFCEIVAGLAPSHLVYEDSHMVAFLDINPAAPYHTLVVPRTHAPAFDDLTPDQAARLGSALPTVAKAVQAAAQVDRYNLVQNNGHATGQRVFHVHVHVIPRHTGDQLVSYKENGVLNDRAVAEAQREKLRALISESTHQSE